MYLNRLYYQVYNLCHLSFQILSPEALQQTVVKTSFQPIVTGIVFLDMEEFLMPILEQEGPDDVLFQQDGAPLHFHKEVTDFLNRKFSEKWIGRGGPITWPPRSPDLTPFDFLFRGYIKDAVYVPPLVTTLPELAGRMRDEVATVTLDVLNSVWTEIEYRYDICRATHDALIEHL
jgi:hypothetical protein